MTTTAMNLPGVRRSALRMMRSKFAEHLLVIPLLYGVVRGGSPMSKFLRLVGAHVHPSFHPNLTGWELHAPERS